VHDGLRRRGAMGDREARTQDALLCGHTGAAEDAASRRPARPDGTSVIMNRALGAARLAAFALVAFSALAFIGLGLGPRTGRYRTLTVLSGSLSPAFEAGDLR